MNKIFSLTYLILTLVIGLFIGSRYYYFSPFYNVHRSAVAVIHPTEHNRTSGIVHFKQLSNGVEISAELNNLKKGDHGFHIHEFGDCSCKDASCAGDHFNPTDSPHGGPTGKCVHAGDLGNIVADESGNASYHAINHHISLNGPKSIIGRSVIVHEKIDDLTSQPSGNAGARIGCGVIGISKK